MTKYSEEQQVLINQKLADQDTLNGFLSYDVSERIVSKTGQTFAVFGNLAFELLDQTIENDEALAEFIPVIIEGVAFGRFPEEGRVGILHLQRISKLAKANENPVWLAVYLSTGWLYTNEL